MDNGKTGGMIDLVMLRDLTDRGEIDTVIIAFPDLYGRLLGKRVSADFFLSDVASHGIHACDYLLTADMEMEPDTGYRFSGWEKGYGDMAVVPDWSTLRVATWLPKTAIVLGDLVNAGGPVRIAPRAILRAQLERAAKAGYRPMGAAELEFFLFDDTYTAAREKGFQNLTPSGAYREDYHILQGTREEPFIGAVRRHLGRSGIPVETSKGEWGCGQHEINLRYSEFLEACDRAVLFKEACKEIAIEQERAVTFMAKWDSHAAGSSMHVHTSLWDSTGGRNLFHNERKSTDFPVAVSPIFRWYLGGLLAHARELTLFFAPNVNSYKRYHEKSFAPTNISWGYDNRTVGFRVVGKGKSLRVECRIPGADANPYLVFSALLAAGLDGIENRIDPPPPAAGNAYRASAIPQVPRTLREAIEELEKSEFAHRVFGDDVVEHYARFARIEQEKFDRAVTDWEKARLFERG